MPLPRPRRLAPPLILAALSLASAVSAADPGRGPATLERPAATALAPPDEDAAGFDPDLWETTP